jgi:hypothetical protein
MDSPTIHKFTMPYAVSFRLTEDAEPQGALVHKVSTHSATADAEEWSEYLVVPNGTDEAIWVRDELMASIRLPGV